MRSREIVQEAVVYLGEDGKHKLPQPYPLFTHGRPGFFLRLDRKGWNTLHGEPSLDNETWAHIDPDVADSLISKGARGAGAKMTSILSDGVGLHVHFALPGSRRSKDPTVGRLRAWKDWIPWAGDLDGEQLVAVQKKARKALGIDPGAITISYAARTDIKRLRKKYPVTEERVVKELRSKTTFEKWSAAARRRESGTARATMTRQKARNKHLEKIASELGYGFHDAKDLGSPPPRPKSGLGELIYFAQDLFYQQEYMRDHDWNIAWRKARFKALIKKKTNEAKYVAKLIKMSGATDTYRPILFVGSWVRAPGLRCGPPSPGMAFYRRLQKWFDVVRVYEANTSRLFYANGQELLDPLHGADMPTTDKRWGSEVTKNLKKMRTSHLKKPGRRHGAKRRETLDDARADAWIDRDLNGALAILLIGYSIVMGWGRPAEF